MNHTGVATPESGGRHRPPVRALEDHVCSRITRCGLPGPTIPLVVSKSAGRVGATNGY